MKSDIAIIQRCQPKILRIIIIMSDICLAIGGSYVHILHKTGHHAKLGVDENPLLRPLLTNEDGKILKICGQFT